MSSTLSGFKPRDTYQQLLHIDGGVNGTPKVVYDGDGTGTPLKLSTTAVAIETNSSTQPSLKITQTGTSKALVVEDDASDTTPFVVDGNGFVGIGVANPTAPLHVGGDVVLDSVSVVANAAITFSGNYTYNTLNVKQTFTFKGTLANTFDVLPNTVGKINNVIVGDTNPASGKFTTLTSTGNTSLANVVATAINSTPIGATTPSTGGFTTLTASGNITGSLITANAWFIS